MLKTSIYTMAMKGNQEKKIKPVYQAEIEAVKPYGCHLFSVDFFIEHLRVSLKALLLEY
jgi:hypothetical protein